MVLAAVRSRSDHPTADQIYLELRKENDKISKGTVYRNLNLLSENKEITHVEMLSADRYDARTDRHYHVVCKSCGVIYDAPIEYQEKYDEQIEQMTGFVISGHKTTFEGLCPKCKEKLALLSDKNTPQEGLG